MSTFDTPKYVTYILDKSFLREEGTTMSKLNVFLLSVYFVSTTSQLCVGQEYSVFPGAANKAFADGKFDIAIKLYTQAIEDMEAHQQTIDQNMQLRQCYVSRAEARVKLKPSIAADRELIELAKRGLKIQSMISPRLIEDAATRELERTPQDTTLWQLRAEVRCDLEKYQGAIEDYSKALALAKSDDERQDIYNNRSIVYRRLDQDAAALADLSSSIRLKPDQDTAYLNRAQVYRESGRFEEAIADYSHLIEKTRKDDPFFYTQLVDRAKLYQQTGNFSAARADLDTLLAVKLDNSKRVNCLSLRAQVLSELGLSAAAQADEREVALLDPKVYSEKLKPALDAINQKRLEVLLTKPLDEQNADTMWNLGNALGIGAFTNLISQGNKAAMQINRSRVERAAELAKVSIAAFPTATGDKGNDLRATIQFVIEQRDAIQVKIAENYDPRLAEIFALGADLSLLVAVHGIGNEKLNRQFANSVLARGPKTGLPETAWRDVAEAVAANKSPQELAPIKRRAVIAAKEFFASQTTQSEQKSR